ncbi:MAG: hypothetical protein AAGH99_05300 [Planctomycetota bacterium]
MAAGLIERQPDVQVVRISPRTRKAIDDLNREALAIEMDYSLPLSRVVRVLAQIAEGLGHSRKLRLDNGSEFVS